MTKTKILSAVLSTATVIMMTATIAFANNGPQHAGGSHSVHAARMIEGRPFITDPAAYNLRDMFGSPLGHFQLDTTSSLNTRVGYRYFGLGDERAHTIGGEPLVRMGTPGRSFFEVYYGLNLLGRDNVPSGLTTTDVSLPLNRFGFTLATRSEGGFMGAFTFDGYIGTQDWGNSNNSRLLGGVENFRIDMGSQVHPLALVMFYVALQGQFDSLHIDNKTVEEERAFGGNLPAFGLNVLVSGEEIPVDVNFAFNYAMNRFVYTIWGIPNANNQWGYVGTPYGYNNSKNAPAIISNHLDLTLQGRYDLPLNERFALSPALSFGYSRNDGGEYAPNSNDNVPWRIGRKRDGDFTYALSGFHMGLGTGFKADIYADLFLEYSLAMMWLDVGNGYSTSIGGQPARMPLGYEYIDSRNLHHVRLGASTTLNQYIDNLPLILSPRVAYFWSGSTLAIDPVHTSLDPLNPINTDGRSQHELYEPYYFLRDFARTTGLTFGLEGQWNMLSTELYLTLLNKKIGGGRDDLTGSEFGIIVNFTL